MGEIVAESEPNVSDTGINGGEEPHMMMKKKKDQNHTVEIVLRTVGPARPSRLRVSSPIKVCDLRQLIAEDCNLPIENLRLILQGNVLQDNSGNGEDVFLKLKDGDSLIVAVKPKPPVKHLRNEFDDDDEEEDLKFQLPQSSSQWKRRLYSFLHDKLKLPDILLMAIFSLSLKAWAVIVLWFILAPVAHRLDLGPLFILGTGFVIIILNLGQRQPGDLSAYSIFNEEFRELPGTLNADRLDRDIRTAKIELIRKHVLARSNLSEERLLELEDIRMP